jgi:plastocyanin
MASSTPGRWAATIGMALVCSAQAATLSVTVTDKDDKPVPDAAVLLRYVVTPSAKPPAPPAALKIDQQRLQFRPFLTIAAVGTTLRFTNLDAFDHHIRGTAPKIAGNPGDDFELRIGPGEPKPTEVKVGLLGRYALACHLHSSMRGYVLVTDTPWFAKTDAEGRVTFTDLPDGLVDVQLYHPEEFLEQPPLRAELGVQPAELSGKLNFVPRRRRAL